MAKGLDGRDKATRGATVKMNEVCPGCYSMSGSSIVMKEDNGKFQCPNERAHLYKKNEEGFMERVESW
ncbi:MAG: hypothetical protein V1911_01120 [Candidatus Micrarchaeota archaeon]